jgi:prepilin-type N-terminal cleavage/methylation domain-containing protein
MQKNKGFTLMELLVVIAIIGILATIVLASLSDARNKGADASTKSNLTNARSQAEIYYNDKDYSFYVSAADSVCLDVTGSIYDLVLAAAKSAGDDTSTVTNTLATVGAYNQTTCHVATDGISWAAEAPLKASASGSPVMWCVDSTGASLKTTTVLVANGTACPAS